MLHFDPDEFDDADTFMAFQRLEGLGDDLTEADFEFHDPPDDVWASIAHRVQDANASGAVMFDSLVVTHDAPPNVVGIGSARSKRAKARWIAPLSAAAAVAVLAGVIWATISGGSSSVTTELASAPLDELQGSGASATAELVRADDGELRVRLANANMPPAPDGFFYEIWLVDPDVTNPRSLSDGSMDGRVDFSVPEGIDPAEYPIIDVSLEPDDGNPAHAGVDHSVARGVLEL